MLDGKAILPYIGFIEGGKKQSPLTWKQNNHFIIMSYNIVSYLRSLTKKAWVNKMAKKTIAAIVEENKDFLANRSLKELFAFAKENGFDSQAGFPRFKKALLNIGVDYNNMRYEIKNNKLEELKKSATKEVTFYSDAKASHDRFAICDDQGSVVWYGKFYCEDDYNGEQSSGELCAAMKAVWLASHIKRELNLDGLKLNLIVDAEWLKYANNVIKNRDGGGKARALGEYAIKNGIYLNVTWISGEENPADRWTTKSGFQKYDEVSFEDLVSEIE